MANSTFLGHIPCPACHSQDNGAKYGDGTARCYGAGCEARWRWDEGAEDTTMTVETQSRASQDLAHYEVVPLSARSITEATCRKWGYGYDRAQDCHVANYCDRTGRVVAQKLRERGKSFRWRGDRTKCNLYGEWLWGEGGRMLVITEGEIDALSVSQVQENRWPVASIPDGAASAVGAITRSLAWVESFQKVVIMFDQDEPGRLAAEEVAKLLTPGKACVAVLPEKDPNELLMQGRGREIVSALWDAKPWRPEGILTGDAVWAAIQGYNVDPLVELPFPDLDRRMRGLHRGEITLLAAGVGAGKSTLVRTMELDWAKRGLKVGVLPLEESVGQSALGILGLDAGVNVQTQDMEAVSGSILQDNWEGLADRFVFCEDEGMRDEAWVFDRLRYMAVGCGCDIIVVDPLTVVIGAQTQRDDRKFADILVTGLESLVKRTGVSVMVSMHLRKVREGRSHEEGQRVSMSDVRGSGLIAALSHNVIAYERDQQADDPTVSRLRVLKCRRTGRTGASDWLRFDEGTGRLGTTSDPSAVDEHAALLQPQGDGVQDF